MTKFSLLANTCLILLAPHRTRLFWPPMGFFPMSGRAGFAPASSPTIHAVLPAMPSQGTGVKRVASEEGRCRISATVPRSHVAARIVILLASLLAGCAAVPQTVTVPVAVSCIPETSPTAPAITHPAELALLDDYALVLKLAAERLELISWSRQAEVVIQGCR